MRTLPLLALALLLSLSQALITASQTGYPNVLFHGIGDSCDFPGMGQFTKNISNLTGAYALCVPLGIDQSTFSWFDPLDDQGEDACNIIHNDTNLQGTINVIGLSQGGVIGRYIIEKCGLAGRVSKFLSIAGPHMGTNSIPRCAAKTAACDFVNTLTRDMVYTKIVQEKVAPAGYFKDMNKYDKYLQFSSFLADLNNERTDSQNKTYATLMEGLDGFMLVMFNNDTVLDPPQTAWFGYYDVNGTVIPMEQQQLYQEDWIGIKTLDEQGKIKMVALPGDHLSFTDEDILNIFVPFLLS